MLLATLLLALSNWELLWYAVPLVVSVSLVYGATRHELMVPILHQSLRAASWIVGFMAIIFGVLLVVSWML